ncbi:MAG: hypothetical protein KAU62_09990 [Candidatus Heimdallarchaeota archaeon]|nr:hypothetical protein [Candidatus Heimdallarchaeota archaeon]MCK4611473.1 hypothetical protein [Candidatus Heimdallarchaeota archaeon]
MSYNFEIEGDIDDFRIANIRLGRANFQTPYCGLIHTELERLEEGVKYLRTEEPTKEILEVIIDIKSQHELFEMVSNETKKEHILERMNILSKKNHENICHFRLKPGISLSALQLCQIVAMQVHTNAFSVISLPDPLREISDKWKSIMKLGMLEAKDSIETGRGYVLMPTISLEQPNKYIESKVEWLLEQGIEAISFRAHGSNFPVRLNNATSVIKQSEEQIWIHLYDLKKKYLDLSQVHLVPLSSVDTVCVKKGHGYFDQPLEEDKGDFAVPEGIPLESSSKARKRKQAEPQRDVFESQALGFLSEQERTDRIGHEIICRCPLCYKAQGWTDFVRSLGTFDRKALLQVHEHFSFYTEMQLLRQRIVDNDVSSYYNSKLLIQDNKNVIVKRFPTFTYLK